MYTMKFPRLNRRRLRPIVFVLLILWSASWLLEVFQPCCEAVAASLPHEHHLQGEGHRNPSEHGTLHHHETAAGHRHAAPEAPPHQHCHQPDSTLADIPALIATNPLADSQGQAGQDVAFVPAFVFDGGPVVETRSPNRGPPCPPQPVYRSTQRLRI